ncbi:MAG: hypothetical protein OEW62_07650 [Candidatus Bathyarchaeota archaeon]|nr:hypothetical protein [Candidatus Bathyarchaeota archaeon]MDH5734413.1 hypothetical protein [Candidatus Bathyarchaeota archaeon]
MTKRRESNEIDYKYLVAVVGAAVVLLGISVLFNPTSVFDIIAGIVAILIGLYLMALPIAPDTTKDFGKAVVTLLSDFLRLVASAFANAVNGLSRFLKERKKRKQDEETNENES